MSVHYLRMTLRQVLIHFAIEENNDLGKRGSKDTNPELNEIDHMQNH